MRSRPSSAVEVLASRLRDSRSEIDRRSALGNRRQKLRLFHVQPLTMTTVETLSAAITSGKTTEDRAPHAEEMGKLVTSDPTAMKELWYAPPR